MKSFEMSEGNQNFRTCFGSKKFRIGALVTGILLFLLFIFLGGFFAGRASNSTTTTTITSEIPESEVTTEPVLPGRLEWVGVCPNRTGVCPPSYDGTPTLLIVSLDGFRPDYLERGVTPTLSNLAKCGTRAPFMYPVFPSKTFPNHYSQVTGLNPASHGIIDNTMYDPVKRKLFKVGTPESLKSDWWTGEPIWVTAEKLGKPTGCFFWPGSEVKIYNVTPTYFRKYSSKTRYEDRVDTVLGWLDQPVETRPVFFTLYVNEPDHAGHAYGINSQEVNTALKKVDGMITRLFEGLQRRSVLDCINVIIVSDHGMADTSCDRLITLDKYINISSVHSQLGVFGRLRPKGPKNRTFEEGLVSSLQCKGEHMRTSFKEQLPVRYHYASNARIEPVYIDIDSGWMVGNYNSGSESPFCLGGNHGYDNLFPDMKALFMAIGPSFKEKFTVKPFINTELYEMMTELINITSLPNNGTKGSLHHLLKDPLILPAEQVSKEPPSTLKVALDEEEYNTRVYLAHCTCKKNENQIDANQTNSLHLPFGVPHKHADGETLRLLYNDDYIAGLDVKYRLPLWTSFTIYENGSGNSQEPCWTGDARVPTDDVFKCTDYNNSAIIDNGILQRPLFPPDFSSQERMHQVYLITNAVPKYEDHVKYIESTFNEMLSNWVKEHSLNVVMGPAFDVLATGVYPNISFIMNLHEKFGPLVVPTHYFAVVTWCQTMFTDVQSCNSSELDTVGFLLPNFPFAYNCEKNTNLIAKHAARVVDIEALTGISFFTELPTYDAIRLRTSVPQRQMAS